MKIKSKVVYLNFFSLIEKIFFDRGYHLLFTVRLFLEWAKLNIFICL